MRLILLRTSSLLLIGAAAAIAGMGLIPASEYSLGPVAVSTSARVGPAGTTLKIPPVGALSARTHNLPLAVTVSVTEVDPLAIGEIVSASADQAALQAALSAEVSEAIEGAATRLATRSVLGGVVLGGVVLALLPRRRWSWAAWGALGGLLGVGLLLTLTWRQFDQDAFREPTFTGSLERAPQFIRAIQQQSVTLDQARSRVTGAAARLSRVLTLLGQPVADPQSDSVAILHVSDIHSNPLGLEFVRELASRFGVDAILDTGDLTSFGEPIEARVVQLVTQMGVPYLFVPGNHDSDAVRASLDGLPNVVLLEDGVQDVEGVRIQGRSDPSFTARGDVTAADRREAVADESLRLARAVEANRPDVLAVHDPALAEASIGRVPLVLAGHKHRQGNRQSKGSLVLEVASTGATGLGSFLTDSDLPYEAQILYFQQARVVAYDYVRFRGLGNDFQIQRRTLAPQESQSREPSGAAPAPPSGLGP